MPKGGGGDRYNLREEGGGVKPLCPVRPAITYAALLTFKTSNYMKIIS